MYRRYTLSTLAMSLNNQLKEIDTGVDLFALDSKLQVSVFKMYQFPVTAHFLIHWFP
jgi:hypothetical protein